MRDFVCALFIFVFMLVLFIAETPARCGGGSGHVGLFGRMHQRRQTRIENRHQRGMERRAVSRSACR